MTSYRCMIRRMLFVLLLIVCGFCFVGSKMFQVQILRHDELFAKAKNKYTAKKKSKGIRGEIYDRNGNRLVCNLPVVKIVCDPSIAGDAEQCEKIARFFVEKAGCDYTTVYQRLMKKEYISTNPETGEKTTRPVLYAVIAENLDLELARSLEAETKLLKFRGFRYESSFRRIYPKDEMLANILGFSSIDQGSIKPMAGLEKSMDNKMKSGETLLVYERGRDGRPVSYSSPENTGSSVNTDGFDIYLTIQEPIQAILESELDKMMEDIHPRAAYAVMADPYTGDIIAAAQRPTFNPNDRSTMSSDAYRNRIAEDILEPGSIVKPFVVAEAMDLGILTPDSMVDCEQGQWVYAKKVLHDSHNVGKVTLTEVIKQSSNIGTAKVALLLGEKRLDQTLRKFGFGKNTGVPLRPETRGILRPVEKWDGLSITRFCIGQGIGASPLQLVRAYCMLANGGYPVNLRLVDRIENDIDSEKFPYVKGPNVFRRSDTADRIHRMMKLVTMPGGTATQSAIRGYYVCGKTGTAEKFSNGAYQKKYFASFCGFVPSVKPKFVLLVTCDEPPKDKYYGGSVSGPVFAAIAERTLKYLREPYEVEPEAWDAEWKAMKKKDWERRVRQDEEVRRRRAARDAAAAQGGVRPQTNGGRAR